jgi:hypothetical protein
MAHYTLRSLDVFDHVQASCEIAVPSEEEAREIAKGLLSDDEFQTIELWELGRLICRMARAN